MSKIIHLHTPRSRILQKKNVYNVQNPLSKQINFEQLKSQLNHQSHLFIVILGTLLGATIALSIGYSIKAHLFSYLLLTSIPIIISYILRKVYIYTLLNFQD